MSYTKFIPVPDTTRCLVIGAVLLLTLPKSGRAEDSLYFKNQSWQEFGTFPTNVVGVPTNDRRIRVDSQYSQLDYDLSTTTHLSVMGLIDGIVGATPTGELPTSPGANPPFAHMEDRRKAWDATLSHQFDRVSVTVGFANSRESDYVSNGISLNTVTDFNDKNTSLLIGYGRTDDKINEEKLGWTTKRAKTGNDFMVGVNQLIDMNTSMSVAVSYGQSRGFESDPYKIVSTTKLDLDPGTYYTPPENRPTHKNKVSIFLGLNHNLDALRAAIDASYRFYNDTYGISSSTLTLIWLQKVGENISLQPSIRYMEQSAADFYYPNLDKAGVITTYEPILGETGTGRAPFYSSDYRLSHMRTTDYGFKVVWTAKPWLAVDVALNRYEMHGLDGVTPQILFCKANTITFGVKFMR
jgi:hypothetical protein